MTPEREEYFRVIHDGSYTKGECAEIWGLIDGLRKQVKQAAQKTHSWRKLFNTWVDRAKKAEAERDESQEKVSNLEKQIDQHGLCVAIGCGKLCGQVCWPSG